MPPRAWLRAWKKAPWMRLLSGLTSQPSTLDLGAESWIASLRASRVSRTPAPESERATPTSALSGRASSESSRSASPLSSSSRTSRHSCASTDLFGSDYTVWASSTLRRCWQPRTSSGRSSGGGGSSSSRLIQNAEEGLPFSQLPAPTVSAQTNRNYADNSNPSGEPRDVRHSLERLVPMLPCPTSRDFKDGDAETNRNVPENSLLPRVIANLPAPKASDTNGPGQHGTGGLDLRTAVMSLPTPRASDGPHDGPNQTGSGLTPAIAALPAPVTSDGERENETYGGGNETLLGALASLPSPTSQDSIGSGAAGYSTESGRHSGTTLTDAVCGAVSAGRRGRLNPLLSEWIQGLPVGWSDCAPLETSELRRWLERQRSTYSRVVSDSR